MSSGDQELYGTMIKVENKDIFIDLRQNSGGMYLKLSERTSKSRSTVLIPAIGIGRLKAALDEVYNISSKHSRVSNERKSRIQSDPEVLQRSVYVSGLDWSTSDESLQNHFASVGNVRHAVVLKKTRGGKVLSLGCGVVEFDNSDIAAQAVVKMNDTTLDGRQIKCREDRNVDGEDNADGSDSGNNGKQSKGGNRGGDSAEKVLVPNKVFVTSLSWDTTSDDLLSLFSTCGEVVSSEVLKTKKGKSLGHGIIEFQDPDSAVEAIERLNDKDLDNRKIVVRAYYSN